MTATFPSTVTTGATQDGDTGLDVVTGAFSYSGRAIAAALVDSGRRVRTMTGHPGRAPRGTTLEVRPLDFDDQPEMLKVGTWIRWYLPGPFLPGSIRSPTPGQ